VTETTYFRWRREFGGLKTDQVKRLKDLEAENARLRRAVSDLTLDKMILAEAAKGNFQAPRVGGCALSTSGKRSRCPSVASARCSGSIAIRSAKVPHGPADEHQLVADIVELACQYGRYGYRKIAGLLRGVPRHIRSDNGPEFVAASVRSWIAAVGASTALHRARQSVGERLHRELQCPAARRVLNGEIFYSLRHAQIVIESWRRHFNTVRPHGSLGYRPPAPEVFIPASSAWPAARERSAPSATLPLASNEGFY
jgi:transposase InsO family protein